jgi:hypothetical protein
MSLFQQIVQAVEEARGVATRAENGEQAWAGKFSEQLLAYLNAPPEAIRYVNGEEGRVVVHIGFPRLQQAGEWHAFQLEIATDTQKRHRFLLNILFQKFADQYRIKLGSEGEVFVVPSQRDDFFDYVFVHMLADLKTKDGRETARQGGIRTIGK